MKKLLFPLAFFAFLLIFTGSFSLVAAQNHSDYLERGLHAEQNGDYETALDIWFRARQDLGNPNLEIATEYLRVTTEQDLKKYYQMAYAMYLWGLSAESIEHNSDALLSEIDRLRPITSGERYNRWRTMLSEGNPEIQQDIISFWNEINILPLSSYNPRVIEHWNRIAYAREQFSGDSAEPYGTDIRGEFYVKYGPPNRKGTIDLEITVGDIYPILSNIPEITGTQLTERSNSVLDATNQYIRGGTVHIWIYDTTTESEDLELTLYFREKPNGEFEREYTIDDLIPSSAFGSRKNSAGTIAQMVYYNRLRTLDPQFATIHSSMESDLYFSETSVNESIRTGRNFKFLNRAKAQSALKYSPAIASTDFKTVSEIPLDIHQYRALNEDNEPILITYVQNRPMRAFYLDITQSQPGNRDLISKQINNLEQDPLQVSSSELTEPEVIEVGDYINNYRLRNTLHLRTPGRELLSSTSHAPVLVINEEDEDTPSVSVFEIPHLGNNYEQIFYSELRNNDPESSPLFETSLPANLRGLGIKRLKQPDHFDLEPGKLFASDLIIGFQKNEELLADDRFPFIVSNDGIIPQREPLVVHFEVYQLGLDDRNFSRFEVDYEFRSVSRFFNLFGRSVEGISSTLSFEHDSDRFVESLEIETGNLGPGEYDLNITVNDMVTDQTVKRTVRFEIAETDELSLSNY